MDLPTFKNNNGIMKYSMWPKSQDELSFILNR